MFEVITLEEFIFILAMVGLNGFFVVLLIVMSIKTPMWTFFGGKAKLWLPRDDRSGSFEKIDVFGGLGTTKDGRTYNIDRDHFWKEKKSGSMIAIAYSNEGRTVDPRMHEKIQLLKSIGIMNLKDLKAEIKKRVEEKDGFVLQLQPGLDVDLVKIHSSLSASKTIDLPALNDYYSGNNRADLNEARIQHRIAVEEKMAGKKDIFKWIVILSIVMIVGTICIVALMTVTNQGGGGVDVNALAQGVAQGITDANKKVVTGAQGAAGAAGSVAGNLVQGYNNATIPAPTTVG